MTEKKINNSFITLTAILLWLVYSCIYIALKKNENTAIIAGWFKCMGEVGLDVAVTALAFLLFKKIKISQEKTVFFIFFISFAAILFQDFIFNVSVNLLGFKYDNPIILAFIHISFIIFLLCQLMAWSLILFSNRIVYGKSKRWIYATSASLTLALLIFVMFIFGVPWKIGYFSTIGLFQTIVTILEAISFPLAAICLARSSSQPIRFLSIGYLLVVSADFIIRYRIIEGFVPYLSFAGIVWISGALMACLGFLLIPRNDKEKLIKLSPSNNIQSQIAMWMLSLWLLSVFLFVGTYAIFSGDNTHGIAQMSKNLLSMIIPFSVLAISSSSYISKKISSPLARLEHIISNFLETGNTETLKSQRSENNLIFEFNTFENFTFNAFDLYKKKHQIEIEFASIAAQVAHDIQSPLAVLQMSIAESKAYLPEKIISIQQGAIQRVRDIERNLLTRYRYSNLLSENEAIEDNNIVRPVLVSSVLEKIINQKTQEWKDNPREIMLTINSTSKFLWINTIPNNFERVLSNLLNNAYEALNQNGKMEVILESSDKALEIIISDNGIGILPENISQVLNGVSLKHPGKGMGLSSAIKYMEEGQGKLVLTSEFDQGTQVKLTFPLSNSPWITTAINLKKEGSVLIVDDDTSIHELWRTRLQKIGIQSMHFNSSHDFFHWYENNKIINTQYTFFVDYELKEDKLNGVDILKMIQPQKNGYLITGHAETMAIQKIATELNLWLISKRVISDIPLNVI